MRPNGSAVAAQTHMTKPHSQSEREFSSWSIEPKDLELRISSAGCHDPLRIDANREFARPSPCEVGLFLDTATLDFESVGVFSTPIDPISLRTIGCAFGQAPRRDRPSSTSSTTSLLPLAKVPPSAVGTRIRPPNDLVKLED